MKRFIFLLLMLVTLFSCTKTIDFEDEELAHLAVVNSIIWPDQSFSVMLNQSTSILTNEQTNRTLEGTMDLFEDGTLIRQLTSQSGVFSADDIYPRAGKNYRMVISTNGQQVEAETTIPPKADIVSVDTTNYNGNGLNHIYFKIKINDAEGDDYYRLVLVNENLVMFPAQNENDTTRYLHYTNQGAIGTDDPVFKSVYNNFGDEIIDYGPENDYFIFPDTYFQGKEYTLQFYISGHYINPFNPNPGSEYGGGYNNPNDSINKNGPQQIYGRSTIHVQHLSKDFYNYLKYLKLYHQYHDNPFSEPVAVYSNVKNGAGIFAGFNDDVKLKFENTSQPYSMDTIMVQESNQFGY